MREITSHIVNPVNDKIKITVLDEPGPGGAYHIYGLSGMDFIRNEAAMKTPDDRPDGEVSIMLRKRDPELAHLTKLGRAVVGSTL